MNTKTSISDFISKVLIHKWLNHVSLVDKRPKEASLNRSKNESPRNKNSEHYTHRNEDGNKLVAFHDTVRKILLKEDDDVAWKESRGVKLQWKKDHKSKAETQVWVNKYKSVKKNEFQLYDIFVMRKSTHILETDDGSKKPPLFDELPIEQKDKINFEDIKQRYKNNKNSKMLKNRDTLKRESKKQGFVYTLSKSKKRTL